MMDGPSDRDIVLGLAAETEEEYFVAPLPDDDQCEFLSCMLSPTVIGVVLHRLGANLTRRKGKYTSASPRWTST